MAVILHGNNLFRLCAWWIWRCEDLLELLKTASDSLDTNQIPNKSLDEIPTDENLK